MKTVKQFAKTLLLPTLAALFLLLASCKKKSDKDDIYYGKETAACQTLDTRLLDHRLQTRDF